MANPSNFQITPIVENNEINFRSLYLHHTRAPDQSTTAVNNWPVYDGPGLNTVVARAHGLRIYAGNGNWHNSFSLVFEVGRFKGSTLQVMGISVEEGELAIVGGTGKFTRATGVISKKLHKKTSLIELNIHAFCPLPKGSLSVVPKIGPWGGDHEGKEQDIPEAPRRLESITVCHKKEEVLYSIAFSYIDRTGNKHTAGPWGGSRGDYAISEEIKLRSSEFVKEVSGTFDTYQGSTVITSLKFVTNLRIYGRYGSLTGKGTRFSVPVKDSSVVGFFGRSGKDFLHAVGVYAHPF